MAAPGEADIFSPVAQQKVTLTTTTGSIYLFSLLLLTTINHPSLEDIGAEAAANWLACNQYDQCDQYKLPPSSQ